MISSYKYKLLPNCLGGDSYTYQNIISYQNQYTYQTQYQSFVIHVVTIIAVSTAHQCTLLIHRF